MAKKYQHDVYPSDDRQKVTIGPGNWAQPVTVYEDGTLSAENIEERDSLDLSLEFSEKGEKYYFARELDKNTTVEYVPDKVHKQYRTKVARDFEVKKAFAVFRGDVKRFVTKSLDRYKSLRKEHKKLVDKVLKTKNEYLFTEQRFGTLWNKIYIDSTQFGPYNYDTKLVVSRDIDYINDLLVIKTGNYHMIYDSKANSYLSVPSGNTIVWVSPHEVFNYSGGGNYVFSGERLESEYIESGVESGSIYHTRRYHIINNTGAYALSSRFIKILGGEQIKSDLAYHYVGGGKNEARYGGGGTDESMFYYAYFEYKNKTAIGTWDGVIPSGAAFSIESWSTNPKYVGFDGEIRVEPVDPTHAESVDCTYTVEGEGVSDDYQASIRKAINNAKQKFYKKLNKVLMNKGCKQKNKGLLRYEAMLDRVAQNVYDGLTIVRNDQINKLQGLNVADPENSPIYYDGTSELYGGSLDTSSYDALYTSKARIYSDLQKNTTTDTSSASSGGSSSGGGSSSTGY